MPIGGRAGILLIPGRNVDLNISLQVSTGQAIIHTLGALKKEGVPNKKKITLNNTVTAARKTSQIALTRKVDVVVARTATLLSCIVRHAVSCVV